MKNKNSLYALLSFAVFMADLWGGSYLIHRYWNSWQLFPTLITALIVGFISYLASMDFANEAIDDREETEQ